MVELRKRKAQAELMHLGPAKKKLSLIKDSRPKVRDSVPAKKKTNDSFAPGRTLRIGDMISLETFGGEINTHEGKPITLKALVNRSKSGVVLFTYPKASTPGCKYHNHFPL